MPSVTLASKEHHRFWRSIMFVTGEMNIPMLSLLLLLFVIVGLLYLLNKWMIVRYKNQKITIGHDLNIVFQAFYQTRYKRVQ